MTFNATQLNQLSNQFQQLSNLARQAGSNSPTSGTSAQYFNQLLTQMSKNLQAGGSTSGSTPPGSPQQSASNALTSLLGKFI
jgi:hypothetical protein